jgi:hypothetical protein
MRPHLSSSLSLALALVLTPTLGCFGPKWGTASPDVKVLTIGPATYAPDSGVTDAVREKCEVHREVAKDIAGRVKTPVALAEDPTGGGRVLKLEITKVFAPSGGRYSGPKQVALHGEILEGGQVTASFDVQRSTTRAVSTCNMLDIVTDVIAKDVGKWMKAPTMGAQLGELK